MNLPKSPRFPSYTNPSPTVLPNNRTFTTPPPNFRVTSLLDLLAQLQEVEKQLGKKVVRENGPRVIDLDLLVYGEEVIDLPELTMPHPGILDRDFVLKPLTDLNPMLTHPAWNGQSLQTAMDQLKECFLIEVAEIIKF